MIEINVKTKKREQLVDITKLIRKNIDFSEGILHIFIPHATAALTINENADPNLPKDITAFLNKVVAKGVWMHDKVDNNADAHIKASLIGSSVSIPVKDSEMQLGTWQNVFLCEFDGPRDRKIILNKISLI